MRPKTWFYDVPNQRVPVYIVKTVLEGMREFNQDYSFKQVYFASAKNTVEARFAFLNPAGQKEIRNFVEYILQRPPRNFLERNDHKLKALLKKIDGLVKTKREIVDPFVQIKKLAHLIAELLRFSIISEATVWYLQEYIRDFLEKALASRYSPLFYTDLIAPVSRQYLSEARLALLKIAQKPESQQRALLKRHTKKFFWIKNSYADAHCLNEEYFKKELDEILATPQRSAKELSGLANYIRNIRKKKAAMLKRFSLKDKKLLLAIKWIEYLAAWQDMRKRGVARLVYLFEQAFKKINQETNWPLQDLKCLFSDEISKIKPSRRLSVKQVYLLRQAVRRRKIAVAFLLKQNKLIIKEGKEALAFEQKIAPLKGETVKELRGLAAYGGKVTGRAQVLKSVTEMDRFEKGNILVTSNTTPDWLPVMRRASAILTEKGGITSHAAIVSRELKKPCIVGIKNITLIIKEGDRLAVDAHQGIVRIL